MEGSLLYRRDSDFHEGKGMYNDPFNVWGFNMATGYFLISIYVRVL